MEEPFYSNIYYFVLAFTGERVYSLYSYWRFSVFPGGFIMIFAHSKPDSLAVLWFDYFDFQIRFILNDYPVIYIGE